MLKMSRFKVVDDEGSYYIVDTENLPKSFDDIIEEYNSDEYDDNYSDEDIAMMIAEEWQDMVIENSMSGQENRDMLNKLDEENQQVRMELCDARRDYLIETADISDTLYLDNEIKEIANELDIDLEDYNEYVKCLEVNNV